MGTSSKRQRKKLSKRQKVIVIVLCFVVLGGTCTSLVIMGYRLANSYHQSVALAQTGAQHLRNAETLLEGVSKQPFNEQNAEEAQQEFSAALSSFTQLNTMLQSLPGAVTWIPQVSTPLKAASHLVPLAISGSQAGVQGCQLLELFMGNLHTLASTQGQGLTMANMVAFTQKFQLFTQSLSQVVNQSKQIKPPDLQFDSRLSKMFDVLQKQIPAIQTLLGESNQILALAPVLLGISSPANYLLEVLDSTELRPGGGFVGSYGIITIAGGRLTQAPITDTTLLDHPFEVAGGIIPFPSAYSWFDIAPTWSLRDSNLSADFPTNAHYAEQNYKQEGGKGSFLGVVAITPALIQQVLAITGPIQVPEYHQTVTAENLVSLIHSYQLGGEDQGSGYIPSSDGYSSQRKHFTALLAKYLFERVKAIMPTTMPRFLQLMKNSLSEKDLQLYLNSSQAESLLQSYHLDGAIQPTPGDGLMLVDANIGATKANPYIVNAITDQVTIDAQGNVVHHTSLSYAWTILGPDYGNAAYRDYAQFYAPPGSQLQSQQGWQWRHTSTNADHTVWSGFFTLTFGQKLTVDLQWTDHNVAKKDASGWHYTYLIQRQPGAEWTYKLQIKLPACATIRQTAGGLLATGKQTVAVTHLLDKNTNLSINYGC